MKKTLIALAALAASASFAQSSVTIDGIMDVGAQSINYKGTTVSDIGSNGSSTSAINFRGVEDLGGGLKAEFRVETNWNLVSNNGNTGTASSLIVTPTTVATGTGTNTTTVNSVNTSSLNATNGTFANGELRIGLSGGFGRVDLGAPNLNSLTTYTTGQPFGTAMGGGFRGVYVTDASPVSVVRYDNALKYVTPNIKGFMGTLYYAAKNTNAANGITSTTTGLTPQQTAYSPVIGAYDHFGGAELGLNYNNGVQGTGSLRASVSFNRQDFDGVGTATNNVTTRTLGVNYTYGPWIAYFLQQQLSDSNAASDRNFASVAATYTMGANAFHILYGAGKRNRDATDSTTTMASLGYDYNLSRRTALYGRYESIKDEAGFVAIPATIPATAGETLRTRASVGIRHNF